MEPTVLIVEDSMMYGKLLERSIINHLGYKTIWFQTYADAQIFLEEGGTATIALLDFTLPDALDGEIIDLFEGYDIPSVVVTSTFSEDIQESIWSKRIIDYVVKEGAHSIVYILDLIERIALNERTGILIVDDSKMARNHLRKILSRQHFILYEAGNGNEALDVLEQHSDIKLVLTDFQMPECDGFELTRRIRQNYPMDKLAIIGLSAKGNHQMTIRFIKYGANDFLSKPFLSEMLICRINLNLKIVEQFESLRGITLIDHLTNINNRRYLFEAGDLIFENGMRTGNYPVVAMIDLDNFKGINDKYGHMVGDDVLRKVAETLHLSIRKSDVLSRYGGEEFCIVCRNMNRNQAEMVFDLWREKISKLHFTAGEDEFNVTVSIGICLEPQNSFLEMLKIADEKMYEAKKAGKNRIAV